MRHPRPSASFFVGLSLLLAACSSSSLPATGTDAGGKKTDSGVAVKKDSGGETTDTGIGKVDAPAATTTIAAARQAFNKTGMSATITVNAITTAIQGPIGDQVIWYVEDPEGGPYSGISIFCDPLAATTCPCMKSCADHVAAAPLNTLVSMTATISAYHGQLQLVPSAQTILRMNAAPPPVYIASASDLAEGADSPYRGVLVKFPSTITVDNLTPPSLYNTTCNTSGATGDAGMPLCSGCTPPSYSGFEVNGPGANAFFVEETFFPFVTLASSPECLTQPGAVPVTMGETFPMIEGILELDGFAGKQFLAPVQPSDY